MTALAPAPQAKADPKSYTLRQLIQTSGVKGMIADSLPKHCTPERFLRATLTAMTRTPALERCSQASFMQAMLTLSQFGLEPDGRHAHLIPYKETCQLVIDYKGLVQLVMRSGLVSYLHADIVCENDEFEYDMGRVTKHKINLKEPRGAPYAAYAICKYHDGTEKHEVMSRDEIELIRKRSAAGARGPWVTDWNEMAKKTVFRRMSKWLPMSSEVLAAADAGDDLVDEVHGEQAKPQGESRSDQLAAMLGATPEPGPTPDEASDPAPTVEDEPIPQDAGEESQEPQPQPQESQASIEWHSRIDEAAGDLQRLVDMLQEYLAQKWDNPIEKAAVKGHLDSSIKAAKGKKTRA